MKTLDEVIKNLEDGTEHLSAILISKDTWNDALYYLKTIETTENLYHDAINELSKLKDEDWKDRYLPLTWPELKQMEGKPVWVEFFYEDGQHFDSDWFLVDFVSESFCDVIGKLGTSRLVKNDYWQAYRKERE